MEDENYRNLVVSRINKTLERKIGPDDHIEDVCISKSVWKGMLKLLLAMINGLEQSYLHHTTSTGMASAFFILEIAHTHYWAKEFNDEQSMITTNTATCSQRSSPFNSSENLNKLAEGNDSSQQTQQQQQQTQQQQVQQSQTQEQQSQSQSQSSQLQRNNSTQIIVDSNEQQQINRMTSIESDDVSPSCNVSEAGSMTVNPNYHQMRLSINSYRSTCSDSEIEVNLD